MFFTNKEPQAISENVYFQGFKSNVLENWLKKIFMGLICLLVHDKWSIKRV